MKDYGNDIGAIFNRDEIIDKNTRIRESLYYPVGIDRSQIQVKQTDPILNKLRIPPDCKNDGDWDEKENGNDAIR